VPACAFGARQIEKSLSDIFPNWRKTLSNTCLPRLRDGRDRRLSVLFYEAGHRRVVRPWLATGRRGFLCSSACGLSFDDMDAEDSGGAGLRTTRYYGTFGLGLLD
jgi:hypothetical protein